MVAEGDGMGLFFSLRKLIAFLGQRHSDVVSGVTSLWELWAQGSVWGR